MITDRAKTSLDLLMQQALRGGLAGPAGPCRVEPVATLEKIRQKRMVVLTVSSYQFRLLAILHFRDDAATRAFFAGGASAGDGAGESGEPARAMDERTFLDLVGERGNMICGALNRELGRHFLHVGMSTPNVIDRESMRYVSLLGCGLERHYRLALPDGLEMHASLCVTAYGQVDFHVDPPPADAEAAEEAGAGELELF